MTSKLFDIAIKESKEESKIFAKKSLDIIDQVHHLLEKKNMSQKDLADKLGKSESEISKLLSGLHNMTLKTMSKLEAALGEEVITTPLSNKKIPEIYIRNFRKEKGKHFFSNLVYCSSNISIGRKGPKSVEDEFIKDKIIKYGGSIIVIFDEKETDKPQLFSEFKKQ